MDEARHDPATICSLPGEALSERLAWIRAEILPHAVGRESHGNTLTWELEDAPGLAEKIERLITLERECCSGVEFAHEHVPASGRRRLTLRGVDPQASIFTSSVSDEGAALASDAGRGPGLVGRLARAAGWGTAAALLLCCALPIAIAASVGAAAAAPFASLDAPWPIAASSVLFAVAAFAWESRRQARRACGPRC